MAQNLTFISFHLENVCKKLIFLLMLFFNFASWLGLISSWQQSLYGIGFLLFTLRHISSRLQREHLSSDPLLSESSTTSKK